MSILQSCGRSLNHVIFWNSDWKIFVSKLEVSQQCFIFQREKFNVMHIINPLNAELNPICYLLALSELTIFSTLAG